MGDEWRVRCMSYGQLIIQCVAFYWYVTLPFSVLCRVEAEVGTVNTSHLEQIQVLSITAY